MKRLINKRSGFTLIEIIVVLIIVGILAAIALPNLFGNVSKSRGAQALATLASYKVPLEACLQANSLTVPNSGNCTLGNQGLATASGIWTISIATAAATADADSGTAVAPAGSVSAGTATYTLVAAEGTTGRDITLTRAAAGTWTCSTGTSSVYAGIC